MSTLKQYSKEAQSLNCRVVEDRQQRPVILAVKNSGKELPADFDDMVKLMTKIMFEKTAVDSDSSKHQWFMTYNAGQWMRSKMFHLKIHMEPQLYKPFLPSGAKESSLQERWAAEAEKLTQAEALLDPQDRTGGIDKDKLRCSTIAPVVTVVDTDLSNQSAIELLVREFKDRNIEGYAIQLIPQPDDHSKFTVCGRVSAGDYTSLSGIQVKDGYKEPKRSYIQKKRH